MRIKLDNEARVYVEVYIDKGAGVYSIQGVYLCKGGQYREPPGLLSRIESPRHAFPKTNRRANVKTHSQTKQILAHHVDVAGHVVLRKHGHY